MRLFACVGFIGCAWLHHWTRMTEKSDIEHSVQMTLWQYTNIKLRNKKWNYFKEYKVT